MSGYDYRSTLNQAQKASLDVTRSGGLFPNNRPQNGSLDTFGKPVASKNANTSTSPSAVASQSQFGRGLLQSSTPVTVSQSSATPIASSKPASKTPLIDTLKASAQSDKAVAARKDAAPLPTKQPTPAAREVTSPTLWDRMELLQGPGVDVIVGEGDACRRWCLPVALLSYYSPMLEANQRAAICLSEDISLSNMSPEAFAMFVDWIFKSFIKDSMCVQADPENIDPYANAWILGDMLQCVDFQNYAMNMIYTYYYKRSENPRVVTPAAIDKLLSIETSSAQLATVFIHAVALHFKNGDVVKDGVDEWDTVTQKHPQLRRAMLIAFKYHTVEFSRKNKDYYMVRKKETTEPVSLSQESGAVTPAKRTAEGTSVQKDATVGALLDGGSAQTAAQSTRPTKMIKQDDEAAPKNPFIIGQRAADVLRGYMKQEPTDTSACHRILHVHPG